MLVYLLLLLVLTRPIFDFTQCVFFSSFALFSHFTFLFDETLFNFPPVVQDLLCCANKDVLRNILMLITVLVLTCISYAINSSETAHE